MDPRLCKEWVAVLRCGWRCKGGYQGQMKTGLFAILAIQLAINGRLSSLRCSPVVYFMSAHQWSSNGIRLR